MGARKVFSSRSFHFFESISPILHTLKDNTRACSSSAQFLRKSSRAASQLDRIQSNERRYAASSNCAVSCASSSQACKEGCASERSRIQSGRVHVPFDAIFRQLRHLDHRLWLSMLQHCNRSSRREVTTKKLQETIPMKKRSIVPRSYRVQSRWKIRLQRDPGC